MLILARLWRDDRGVVVSSELILITTVLVLGGLVGLSTFREQLVQGLGDASLAVGALNQSYSFGGATIGGFTVAGSAFGDVADDCDALACNGSQGRPGTPPACMDVGVIPQGE